MRSVEMRKKRRLRSVCAPHSRSAGTSIGPKLSFSVRVALIAAMLRQPGPRRSCRGARRHSGQIENENFGPLAAFDDDFGSEGLERVAFDKGGAVHCHV